MQTTPNVFIMIIVVLASEGLAVLLVSLALLMLFCLCFVSVIAFSVAYAVFTISSTPRGAQSERISKLPKRTFDPSMFDSDSRTFVSLRFSFFVFRFLILILGFSCSICYADYTQGDQLRELPCDHSFHCECVDEWLKINKTCPLCRRDIDKVDIELQPISIEPTDQPID
jgi:hypothetical protein